MEKNKNMHELHKNAQLINEELENNKNSESEEVFNKFINEANEQDRCMEDYADDEAEM